MASSESEDFESADEDICVVDKTKAAAAKKPEEVEVSDRPRPTSSPTHLNLKGHQQHGEASKGNDGTEADSVLIPESKSSNIIKEECKKNLQDGGVVGTPSASHKHRQQRPREQRQREQKMNNKPKKLGTKITSEVKSLQPDIVHRSEHLDREQEQNHGDSGLADIDGNAIELEKSDGELNANIDVPAPVTSSNDVDPYAKFKGYSMPPQMEQCWEPGVDNYALYGIKNPNSSDNEMQEKSESSLSNKVQDNSENSVAPILDKLSEVASGKQTDAAWGGWGNWGVTSLLSTATESVSTLTSHVSSVLESGIGAPKPEDLARISQLEKQKYEAEPVKTEEVPVLEEEPSGLFNFGHLMTSMSSISKLVESTSSKVISGGLDTLETIGKKTMEVLQEGDPGFKKKRAMFSETTVLSQVLREAKEQAEVQDRMAESQQELRNIHFETLFDEFQGLVHLEALEMLSKQCDLKLQTLLLSTIGASLTQLQGNLQKIKENCHLPDDEDVTEEENEPDDWWKELETSQKILAVPVAANKFSKIWNETQEWLKASMKTEELEEGTDDKYSAREIHKKAVSTLAQLTATAMEQFHKGAELLLVKEEHDPTEEAKALKQITSVLCSQVTTTATNFCERMNSCTDEGHSDSVNALITNVFLEASNSSSYIQEAFQLLIPVLQVGMSSS